MLREWVIHQFKEIHFQKTHDLLSKHYRIKTYVVASLFQVSILPPGSSSVALCGCRPPSMSQVIVRFGPPSFNSFSLHG